MKVTFSGIAIVDGTGKIGGNTIQGSRFGKIARVNVRPTIVNAANFNYNSEKAIFREIVSRWRTLSPTQRLSWDPLIPTGLSGFNYYTQANLIYFRLNGTYIDVAPLALASPALSLASLTATHVSGNMTFTVTSVLPTAGWHFNFFASNNLSKGIASPQKSSFRLCSNADLVLGLYNYVFDARRQGIELIAGSQCFSKIVMVNDVTGQQTAPAYYSCLVT